MYQMALPIIVGVQENTITSTIIIEQSGLESFETSFNSAQYLLWTLPSKIQGTNLESDKINIPT